MQLKWEIEDKCNLNCKHCIVGSIDYSKSMALDTAMEVIDKCASSGIDTIALTTKEPFMYPHINELIEYSALHNMQIAILTNGTLINKKNMHTLQKYSSNIKYLFFSLEGVSEYTNDYVRGEGVFRKVLEVANEINEINKKNDSFISMVLQMNLTSKNYSEVLGMVEKFNTFPFIQVRIGKLEIEGNAILHKELHLDNEDYKEAIRKLIYTYSQIDKPKYDLIFKSLSLYDTIYLNTVYLSVQYLMVVYH